MRARHPQLFFTFSGRMTAQLYLHPLRIGLMKYRMTRSGLTAWLLALAALMALPGFSQTFRGASTAR